LLRRQKKQNKKYIRKIIFGKKLLQTYNFLAKSYAQKFWEKIWQKNFKNLAKTNLGHPSQRP
jgi:hypothetical protein